MEIKNQPTQCPNGHYYNAALHNTCPICAQAGGVPPTEPFANPGGVGGFPKTEAPVPTFVPAGTGEVTPFQPTTIGGDLRGEGTTDPVVGWLVCTEGPMRGNDYRLHGGYNYIGREMGDVRIPGDTQISRQNHAMIAYDDTESIFYVGPSAGRNLIKVNGKTVLNPVEIHNYDVISIGTTKLIFVALCGENFDWKRG
ncbi:MAG TPA: FHA domain-containing protein [Candidatus Faecousia excrementigallinarum]|uniref:FHA domain-containing protein n=1 Tax=Candidatus Faecousia excrementigallinarum TaxID=2840806 RepID=A0A9D0Z3B9_9FIRM|nr:FHA domain-containing protein [Candidatus Faecousia excrementigallinarum]